MSGDKPAKVVAVDDAVRASLGCDFCGTYHQPVAVAQLTIVASAFPASICRRCAIEVATALHQIVNRGPRL